MKMSQQADSNPEPHDHKFNGLTTRLPTRIFELPENFCFEMWFSSID